MYSISYTGCKPSSWPTLFTDHLLPPCNLKNKCTLLHHGDRNPSIFMPIIGAPSTLSFSMTRAMLDTEEVVQLLTPAHPKYGHRFSTAPVLIQASQVVLSLQRLVTPRDCQKKNSQTSFSGLVRHQADYRLRQARRHYLWGNGSLGIYR